MIPPGNVMQIGRVERISASDAMSLSYHVVDARYAETVAVRGQEGMLRDRTSQCAS